MAVRHALLEPFVPSAADPFDRVRAAHLLNRAGFGGTPAEVERVLKLGPRDAADWLLDFPDAPAEEQSKDDVPDLGAIEGLPSSFREYRRQVARLPLEERQALQMVFQRATTEAIRQIGSWWLARMAYGPFPLQEKLTLFWHGHFTTSAKDERAATLIWRQNELLRQQAAGNFRDFVRNVSRDPAMLDYLNNTQNHKSRPNENYARELMELFTLGIGNYTEQDVKEAARAFTGWTHDGDDFFFNKRTHDDGEKLFLGRRGTFDGDDVIDLILQRDICPRYVAGKVYRHFVSDDLDDALNRALGDLLWQARYDLRPMLRTLLASKAFYRRENIGVQIKSPVQLVVGTVRVLGRSMPDAQALAGPLRQMGQVPLMPPNVKGWPGGRLWVNTSTLFARYNAAVRIVDNTDLGRLTREMNPGRDPATVADAWLERLIGRPIDQEKRQTLIDALDGRAEQNENVRKMVQLIVSMPEYQLC